jgi:hypothetical protein
MSTTPLALNSRRKIRKSTYTPLILAGNQDGNGGALSLSSMVRSLELQPSELGAWKQAVQSVAAQAVVDTMVNLTQAVSGPQVLQRVATLASSPRQAVQEAVGALGKLRADAADSVTRQVNSLYALYTACSAPPVPEAPPAPPVPTQTIPAELPKFGPNAPQTAAPATPAAVPPAAPVAAVAQVAAAAPPAILVHKFGAPVASSIAPALAWAREQKPAVYESLAGASAADPAAVNASMAETVRRALLAQLFLESLTQLPLQPVGLLHLERLEMIPEDIEQGELLYSLPLSPHEKVTLAHKEWTVTEQEYTDFIEDSLENFSETGVTESTDMATSTSTQDQHTNSLSMSQSPASTGAVTMTPPVSTAAAGSVVDDTTSQQQSKDQSRQSTSLASARTIQDHKVSFTVTTVSGVQDFTARVLENKSPDHSMRVDYYRRMRKWRIELYRYGVRMTYDVVLPDPGARVRQRVGELQQIDQSLATTFSFEIVPSSIQPWNWESLADQYGAVLPAPPAASQTVQTELSVDIPKGPDAPGVSGWQHQETLTIQIPDGCSLSSIEGRVNVGTWPGGPAGWVNIYAGSQWPLFNAGADGWINGAFNFSMSSLPTSGAIEFLFQGQNLRQGRFLVTAAAVPLEANLEQWRQRCWAILHDAAYADFMQQRSQMRDRRTALSQQIAADSAITLRRREREEIMYLVLSWLFPGFSDASSVLNNLPDPGSLDAASWQQIMEYGEYIKFIETAIDWDNVTVQLYPYFWDTIFHEDEKLFLDHPDPIHREFLRAGAARVILAVQPGFEEQVISLLDQGQLGSLPNGSRFQKVVSDVVAANQAYAATAKGDPQGDDPKVPGILIGAWTDYTPTSALDIGVVMQPVTKL